MEVMSWKRYGGYEVSSKGDRRFSAFYAKLEDGRSIEEAYQLDVKGYRALGNDVMLGKGKPSINVPEEKLYEAYKKLWSQWLKENTHMVSILLKESAPYDYVLSDMFANKPINQARALAECINELLKSQEECEMLELREDLVFCGGIIIDGDFMQGYCRPTTGDLLYEDTLQGDVRLIAEIVAKNPMSGIDPSAIESQLRNNAIADAIGAFFMQDRVIVIMSESVAEVRPYSHMHTRSSDTIEIDLSLIEELED